MGLKTILLVEDNPSDIELTKRALGKASIKADIVVADDGQEALDYLFQRPEEELPGLTLLDLRLKKMSGLEVLRRIRAEPKTRRMPVVMLSTSKEEHDVAASYDLGANSYIRKPVDFATFTEYIAHLTMYWLIMNETPPNPREVSPL